MTEEINKPPHIRPYSFGPPEVLIFILRKPPAEAPVEVNLVKALLSSLLDN